MMHTYFNIMEDTAGFCGQTVHCLVWIGPVICTEVLMSCKGISKTLWKIPLYLNDTWRNGQIYFLKFPF